MIRVLYIDDEPDLCDVFYDSFSDEGAELKVFSDPEKAIAASHSHAFDLAFIDYRMPGITGEEVARRLPEKTKKFLLTGESNPKSEYPFSAILAKPFEYDRIRQIITESIQDKSK